MLSDNTSTKLHISIRAPARGATLPWRLTVQTMFYFNPRSREGSDTDSSAIFSVFPNFNPRSREGSDVIGVKNATCEVISIRAPARGATGSGVAHWEIVIFQSALPRGERLRRTHTEALHGSISIRAPARGATSIFAKKFSSLLAKIV